MRIFLISHKYRIHSVEIHVAFIFPLFLKSQVKTNASVVNLNRRRLVKTRAISH